MADRLIKTETLQDIADAIREKRETTSPIRPSAFASEIRSIEGSGEPIEVYDDTVTVDESATPTFTDDYTEGKTEGYAEGKTDGIAEGKQAEHDAFWDSFQDYGNRRDYASGFNNNGWTDVTFRPKYDIVCLGNAYGAFAYSQFTELKKTVDATQSTNIGSMFYANTKLKTIHRLVVSASTPIDPYTFGLCNALENLTIEGTIGGNALNAQYSTKLSKASIESIINALSTTTTGLTVTLSATAVNNAFGGSTSAEWLALVATRSNWTISLA